jgi:hypothetical protein
MSHKIKIKINKLDSSNTTVANDTSGDISKASQKLLKDLADRMSDRHKENMSLQNYDFNGYSKRFKNTNPSKNLADLIIQEEDQEECPAMA